MSERRVAEVAGAGLGVAAFGYLGWDGALWDARLQLLLHLAAVAAIGGLLAMALRGRALPRTPLDVPILALLLAFALAALLAWNHGLSARALAAVLATAAMFPVALLALRVRPDRTALVVSVPVLGLSGVALVMVLARRASWLLEGGPGLPPIRFAMEGTPFGSVNVAPFVILATLPVALLVAQPRLRLGILLGLVAAGLPLALFSGSRSAWLAMLVAGLAFAWPWLGGRLPRLRRRQGWPPRRAAPALLGAAVALLAVAYAAPRVVETGSLTYRAFLWRDTLAAWWERPLLGVGPGGMPFARQVAAPPLSFPALQPHSHDVPLGILGDAGLVGLLAATAVAIAFVRATRPWSARRLPARAAVAALSGIAAGMLVEDLTFLPAFNLLVLLLAAMALTDAGAVAWRPVRLPRLDPRATRAGRAAGVAAAVGLCLVLVLGDAAAIAYREGTEAFNQERWQAAVRQLRTAARLDPWHPSAPRALAVAADRAGDPATARAAAERAVALSPGDGAAWTNLALLCLAAGDHACSRNAASGAVARSSGRLELINAALVHEALGDHAEADRAYGLSTLTAFTTTMAVPWPRDVPLDPNGLEELGDAVQLNAVVARGVLGLPIEPEALTNVHARLLAHAFRGEWARVEAWVERARTTARGSPLTWELAALVDRYLGGDPSDELKVATVARGGPLHLGAPDPPGLSFDIVTFRAYPADGLVAAAERLGTENPWPWALEPYLAPPP